jgi:hypothetical protein
VQPAGHDDRRLRKLDEGLWKGRSSSQSSPASQACSPAFSGSRPAELAVFQLRAWARARLHRACVFGLSEAIDVLQLAAVRTGLVAETGQDAVQAIIAEAFARERKEDKLVEAEPSWREVAHDAWHAPSWREAAVAYHNDRQRGGVR